MSYKVILRSKNRVVLPLKIVESLEWKVGDLLLIDAWRDGRVTIIRAEVSKP